MTRFIVQACTLVVLLCTASLAYADFRRPFNSYFRMNYGYDNRAGDGCTDYNCGGRCYNGHGGSDFGTPIGTEIVAANDGVVAWAHDGCDDIGYLGNTCGDRCGNAIRIDHEDGTHSLYCHLQRGSLTVTSGSRVSCGQIIARSASSGNSTGPHLHFGFRLTGTYRDAYAGSCTSSPGSWVGQGGYDDNPSLDCERRCECTAGATESRSCGTCGTQSRSCGGDCMWQPWAACSGEGECAAGATESRPCCDCGTQTRSCSATCAWEAWGACAGPDPAPVEACETGSPGVCGPGTVRCVEGCLTCAADVPPGDEVCDDLDNDCNGLVDDGNPSIAAGEGTPRFAATIVDYSMPRTLPLYGETPGWLIARNDGTAAWPVRGMALRIIEAEAELLDGLYDSATWPAYDTLALNDTIVQPGDSFAYTFTLVSPAQLIESSIQLGLVSAANELVMCPSGPFESDFQTVSGSRRATLGDVTVAWGDTVIEPDAGVSSDDAGMTDATVTDRTGCSATGTASGAWLLACFVVAFGIRRHGRGTAAHLIVGIWLVMSCQPEMEPDPPDPEVLAQSHGLSTPLSGPQLEDRVASTLAPGELLHSIRSDGAMLVGEVVEAPPNADMLRLVRLRWIDASGEERTWALADRPLRDARVLAGTDDLLAITESGELVRSSGDGPLLHIGNDANAPIALSPSGRFGALSVGESPYSDIAVYDVESGTLEAWTQNDEPVWGLSIGDDGTHVVAMTMRSGWPDWYRVDAGGTYTRLSDRRQGSSETPFPTGPGPAFAREGGIVFEHASGVFERDSQGSIEPLAEGGGLMVPVVGTGWVMARERREEGAWRLVE